MGESIGSFNLCWYLNKMVGHDDSVGYISMVVPRMAAGDP